MLVSEPISTNEKFLPQKSQSFSSWILSCMSISRRLFDIPACINNDSWPYSLSIGVNKEVDQLLPPPSEAVVRRAALHFFFFFFC